MTQLAEDPRPPKKGEGPLHDITLTTYCLRRRHSQIFRGLSRSSGPRCGNEVDRDRILMAGDSNQAIMEIVYQNARFFFCRQSGVIFGVATD
jgi:hypothetical protein